jgi:osmotically-inducible protein OsmY
MTAEKRPDQSILDDVNDILNRHHEIDASDIMVQVDHGEVIFTGTVPELRMKFLAQEVTEQVSGVRKIDNQLHKSESHELQV